jgi:DNA repair exonuclease SbcCD ATPase subunit
VNFSQNQKLLLDGESGSGKSSIIEAIIWSLYGKGRTDNKNLIRRGSNDTSVALELYDDDTKVYRIERSVDKRGKQSLSITEDGTLILSTGVKGNQEYIEQKILKSSYLLFINSIIYLQDNIDTFVRQTASKKKDILLEIINASGYDEYLKKTKDSLNLIKTSQAVNKSQIEHLETEINAIDIGTGELPKLQAEKEFAQERIDGFTEDIERNAIEKEKLLKLKEEKSTEEGILREQMIKVRKNEVRIDELKSSLDSDRSAEIVLKKKQLLELPDLKKKQSEMNEVQKMELEWNRKSREINDFYKPGDRGYDRHIERINKDIIFVMSEEVPVCKKCGAPYDEHESKKQEKMKLLERELEVETSHLDIYNKTMKLYEDKVKELGKCPKLDYEIFNENARKINELEKLDTEVRELESQNNNKDFSIKEIEMLENENKLIGDAKSKSEIIAKEIERLLSDIKLVENIIIDMNRKISGFKDTIYDCDKKIAIFAEDKKRLEKYKEEIESIKEESKKDIEAQEGLELLKEAFGQNGIRAMVIDYVLPQLEDSINKILGTLSDFQVKINTQKPGASDDIVLEGLFIDVINPQGEVFDYENFSGGEKVKVSMAINEALAELSKVNFRIMDETVVSLDNESTQKFLEALESIQERVAQVICVSHIPEVKDIFEDRIVIKKINGISKIE